jgi:hypothetical protein
VPPRLIACGYFKNWDAPNYWLGEDPDPRLFEKAGILFFFVEELTGWEILKKYNEI